MQATESFSIYDSASDSKSCGSVANLSPDPEISHPDAVSVLPLSIITGHSSLFNTWKDNSGASISTFSDSGFHSPGVACQGLFWMASKESAEIGDLNTMSWPARTMAERIGASDSLVAQGTRAA